MKRYQDRDKDTDEDKDKKGDDKYSKTVMKTYPPAAMKD